MMFAPKRKGGGLRRIVILQALALAAFFLGTRSLGFETFADNLPTTNIKLVTADYVESVSISQGAKDIEGPQSESILATDDFYATKADHAFLLNRSYSQLTYRSTTFGSSLIRSPPTGSPGYRV